LSKNPKICVRRGKPVTVNTDNYDLFEGMHWLCFHLEFEYQGDPDTRCTDFACPWWQIEFLKQHISSLGQNPEQVIEQAIKERFKPKE
jgi:hypothetical protein